MFWRFREPDHPANRQYGFDDQYTHVIEEHYRIADRVVGKALEYVDDETLLVALSDHGFASFQRGVNLNTWLHKQGLLVLADGCSPGPNAGDMLRHVDWDQTKAYALGLAGIYVNQQDREARGIVPADEAEDLKRAIANELTGLPDADRGEVAVRSAVVREDAYQGPYCDEAADVLVHYARGYRSSWSTALGGVLEEVFEDNTRKWSGDHIVDPEVVPGVLFMNRPFRKEQVRLEDMAPTVLDALGLAKCPEMQGDTVLI
jgi:predicted AlkP superfamily phosphohydrolase/phosphomutase